MMMTVAGPKLAPNSGFYDRLASGAKISRIASGPWPWGDNTDNLFIVSSQDQAPVRGTLHYLVTSSMPAPAEACFTLLIEARPQ